MGEMATAVLCIIAIVVLGLGNGVFADDASAKTGAADADLNVTADPSSLASVRSGDVGSSQLEVAAESEGETKATVPSVVDTPKSVEITTQPSLPPSQSPPVSLSEEAKTLALEDTSQATVSNHLVNSSVDDETQVKKSADPDLSHLDAKSTNETDETKSLENSSVISVLVAPEPTVGPSENATTVATVVVVTSESGTPNGGAGSQKDPVTAPAETPANEKKTKSNVETGVFAGMNILTQENDRLPSPTAASLVVNETSANNSTEAGSVFENNGRNFESDSPTTSSVEIQGGATVLHIFSQEIPKPLPPTVGSLVEDGKSILPETPDTNTEQPQNTQPSQDQNTSKVDVILPVGINATNATTVKPPKKPPVEKCPTDSTLPCVSKCCPYGSSLVNEKCRPTKARFIPQFTLLINGFNDTKPENETEKMAKYNLIAQNLCVKNRYRLEPFNDSMDEFHLLFNGSLWLPATKPHHSMVASDKYCMEVYKIGDEEVMLPLVCFDSQPVVESSFHFMVYPIGLMISVPFLLATFIVYNMIPELRNLHGKSLSCYVLCLMMAYIFLAVVQLGGQGFDNHVCVGVAFAIQFSFIACFFWLNVLCFDTWRNVFLHGDLGYTMEKSEERSFFIFYSIYAWCFTIVLIIVTMVMNFTPTIPSSYLKPGIGEKTCWFNTEREAFPYFYGPVGVLIIINVILFIMTAIKLILEHHKEATCVRTPTQTFQLCLTLFFIMGINWVMEIISWAAGGPPFIWYITDICNTLQGIFIFVVFVMDERVRGLCKTELFPRLQEFFAACCPQRRTRRSSNEPQYDSINGQEMVYMFKKDDIEH